MHENNIDIEIKNGSALVAFMQQRNGILNGICEWYDGRGRMVAHGWFSEGLPFSGTFLNWAKYFPQIKFEERFFKENYCRNWVSIFEAGFLSESPNYTLVLEVYLAGEKL